MSQYCYDYPLPAVCIDMAVFSRAPNEDLHLLLIQRRSDPHAGAWALPGGFLEVGDGYKAQSARGESLESGGRRELQEETGLEIPDGEWLGQVGCYGDPGRDPRGRVISVAYCAFLAGDRTGLPAIAAADDAAATRWFRVESASASSQVEVTIDGQPGSLAFDHAKIVGDAWNELARRSEIDLRIAAGSPPLATGRGLILRIG